MLACVLRGVPVLGDGVRGAAAGVVRPQPQTSWPRSLLSALWVEHCDDMLPRSRSVAAAGVRAAAGVVGSAAATFDRLLSLARSLAASRASR